MCSRAVHARGHLLERGGRGGVGDLDMRSRGTPPRSSPSLYSAFALNASDLSGAPPPPFAPSCHRSAQRDSGTCPGGTARSEAWWGRRRRCCGGRRRGGRRHAVDAESQLARCVLLLRLLLLLLLLLLLCSCSRSPLPGAEAALQSTRRGRPRRSRGGGGRIWRRERVGRRRERVRRRCRRGGRRRRHRLRPAQSAGLWRGRGGLESGDVEAVGYAGVRSTRRLRRAASASARANLTAERVVRWLGGRRLGGRRWERLGSGRRGRRLQHRAAHRAVRRRHARRPSPCAFTNGGAAARRSHASSDPWRGCCWPAPAGSHDVLRTAPNAAKGSGLEPSPWADWGDAEEEDVAASSTQEAPTAVETAASS